MKEPNAYDVLATMRDCGGHFASNLAKAWMHADAGNAARLADAFPDLYTFYRDLARSRIND